jgi:hypothetical protein
MLMPQNLRDLLEGAAAVIRAEEVVAAVVVMEETIMAVVAMIKAEEVVAVAKAAIPAVVVLVMKGAKLAPLNHQRQVLHQHHQRQVHPQHVQTDLQTAIHLLHPLQYVQIVLPTAVRHHLLHRRQDL